MNASAKLDTRLRDKLLKLRSWNQRCLELLYQLTLSTDAYQIGIDAVEKCLQKFEVGSPMVDAHQWLPNEQCCELFDLAVTSTPIFNLFRSPPLFSEFDSAVVAILVQFADITPNPETLLQTRDMVFMRILDLAVKQGSVLKKRVVLHR